MVSPTTLRPWRTRSAATVELSTPPLMATAMGFSGMHADSAQMGDAGLDGFDQRVNLLGGVGAAERKTHAGTGAVVGEPDRLEHVRGCERAARTGRAGRDREAAQIEGDHERLAIDAIEIQVAGVGHAIPARAVDAGAWDALEHGIFQAIAQGREPLAIFGEPPAGQLCRGAEGRDGRDIFRARTPVALVMAAERNRRQTRAATHVERAYALRRVELVAAHRVEIDPECLHVHGKLAER